MGRRPSLFFNNSDNIFFKMTEIENSKVYSGGVIQCLKSASSSISSNSWTNNNRSSSQVNNSTNNNSPWGTNNRNTTDNRDFSSHWASSQRETWSNSWTTQQVPLRSPWSSEVGKVGGGKAWGAQQNNKCSWNRGQGGTKTDEMSSMNIGDIARITVIEEMDRLKMRPEQI